MLHFNMREITLFTVEPPAPNGQKKYILDTNVFLKAEKNLTTKQI